ncbi:winged helix-turn-helix transcriptional regulator [Nocardiopsis lambiniae]|uniref:winged helix-turn-helix transcriptional regulator n=1 Tax=Nocardiopsis lambiniae TaxID=3075539 RepID=UPI0037C6925F
MSGPRHGPQRFVRRRCAPFAEPVRDRPFERVVHDRVPPQAEYSLTGFGRSLLPALNALGAWGRGRHGPPRRSTPAAMGTAPEAGRSPSRGGISRCRSRG